jgi:hypothetical protein
MRVGIDLAAAVQAELRIVSEPEIRRAEPWMLPGEYQKRWKAASRKGPRDRGEFDGFGPGADDHNNDIGQFSP